jgi:hypothetical protein
MKMVFFEKRWIRSRTIFTVFVSTVRLCTNTDFDVYVRVRSHFVRTTIRSFWLCILSFWECPQLKISISGTEASSSNEVILLKNWYFGKSTLNRLVPVENVQNWRHPELKHPVFTVIWNPVWECWMLAPLVFCSLSPNFCGFLDSTRTL